MKVECVKCILYSILPKNNLSILQSLTDFIGINVVQFLRGAIIILTLLRLLMSDIFILCDMRLAL